MKRVLLAITVLLALCATGLGQYATLTGTLSASNGLPAQNYVISFTPSQFGYISGTGVIVNTATYCATSTNGSVVGVPNPLTGPQPTVGFTGTLPPANYFIKVAWYDAAGNVTLVSPEVRIQLNSTGRLIIAPPASGLPYGASGMKVYIGTATNAETLQGSSTGAAAYLQTVPLVSGAAVPSTNTTICKQIANDAIWPTGTGYTVALTDPQGNTLPGYPMMWQLMGPNTTINLSTGLPYYHGTVYFPTPILSSPLNNALQSIAGPLSLSGYNLINVGAIGVGTNLPAWPIDVENGFINSNLGYLINGTAGTIGQCLASGGSAGPDTWINCLTSTGTVFYQTFDTNGTPLTQRPVANFSSRFAVTDSSSPAQTNIDLANAGTAGTYAYPTSVVTDVYGRVTSITAGSTVSRSCNSNGCYRVEQDGTIIQWGVTPSCNSGTNECNVAVTFPTTFTTTSNLSTTCTPAAVTTGHVNITCTIFGAVSTTGFNAGFAAMIYIGGTGSNLPSGTTANWYAIGH